MYSISFMLINILLPPITQSLFSKCALAEHEKLLVAPSVEHSKDRNMASNTQPAVSAKAIQ